MEDLAINWGDDLTAGAPAYSSYTGDWSGDISSSGGSMPSSSSDALSNFNSVVNAGTNLLSGLGRIATAAQQASTANYVARSNADASKAAAQAQVTAAQNAFKLPALNAQTLMIWLAVAGVVLAAMTVIRKK